MPACRDERRRCHPMGRAPYTKGLHDLGNGLWAYLQPDGGWGWSNAGLIVDGDRSLLVDTLFDLKLTREMLDAMRRASPAAATIDTLVNTHGNGDHWFGNQLVGDARIVTSSRSAREMAEVGPGVSRSCCGRRPRWARWATICVASSARSSSRGSR